MNHLHLYVMIVMQDYILIPLTEYYTWGVASRQTGKIVSVKGDMQTSGTLVDIRGKSLQSGVGLKISGGSDLTTGSLLDIETTSRAPENGLIKVSADAVSSGTVMKISANSLTSGTGMHIISKGIKIST